MYDTRVTQNGWRGATGAVLTQGVDAPQNHHVPRNDTSDAGKPSVRLPSNNGGCAGRSIRKSSQS